MAASGGTTGSYSYGSGPESAHILWTHQFYPTGSIADTRFDSQVYTLSHYESVGYSSIILGGKMHMMPAHDAHGEDMYLGWETWDLYTGEKLSYKPGVGPPQMGQVYLYLSGNQHGTFDYLWRTTDIVLPQVIRVSRAKQYETGTWGVGRIPEQLGVNYDLNRSTTPVSLGTVWEMLDGYTLNTLCYLANVSSAGTQVYGSDGSIDYYNAFNKGTTAAPRYYLTMWNSSAGTMIAAPNGTSAW